MTWICPQRDTEITKEQWLLLFLYGSENLVMQGWDMGFWAPIATLNDVCHPYLTLFYCLTFSTCWFHIYVAADLVDSVAFVLFLLSIQPKFHLPPGTLLDASAQSQPPFPGRGRKLPLTAVWLRSCSSGMRHKVSFTSAWGWPLEEFISWWSGDSGSPHGFWRITEAYPGFPQRGASSFTQLGWIS